jgi:hypothetical protein
VLSAGTVQAVLALIVATGFHLSATVTGSIEAVAAALLERKTRGAEQIDAVIDAVTTERERAIAARIALVRKPLRDLATLGGRHMPRIPDLAESGLRPK